ncbi:phospholipase D-like domain-containing protein [Paraburkholderia sediminicola]|uniref:phospholipase D-like domain-containing protein n=1 Tax=Paraburkholderia sediminicola TaxID=458836 RepID=UPI0038B80515
MPWFVDIAPEGPAEFHPLTASYEPLVNGKEAFGALYDAILAAKHTVDIVCWGFQPSMYFRRDGGKSMRIGDLLILKAQRDHVKVRILCWLDKALVAQFSEAQMPEYSAARFMSQNEDHAQLAYDWQWYQRARLSPSSGTRAGGPARNPLASSINGPGLSQDSLIGSPLRDIGIELVTRDFSMADRKEIMYRENLMRRAGSGSTLSAVGAYGAEPSHHQKMVLIDYEAPEQAVGFVMGHNTLDAYWDDDGHSYVKKAPNVGRNGETPRQDMSAMVTGPILEHLNVNFCRAWQRDANEDLLTRRKPLAAQLKVRAGMGMPVMAQINRTQLQEGVRNIKSLYLQAVRNAARFIYIENQYFRWQELATQITEIARRHVEWGRDPGKDGSIHLFVVTNSSKEAVGLGTGTTYDMLASLGRSDTMPVVARLEEADALGAQLTDAQGQATIAGTQMRNAAGPQAKLAAQQAQAAAQAKVAALQQQIHDNEDKSKTILPTVIPGLKIHVCTLVAPDSPPGAWMPIYVHSKIMIVDDVFLTHGSANINRRSMEVDSELNICHEHMGVTQPLRRRLWNIHTGGKGVQDDPAEAFKQWERIIKRNADNQTNGRPPYASLIGFMSTSNSRQRLD